ncbi:MAG: response regulator, partial [Desulfobacteraceae bacterium]|nr:response regulator [Desulfobacteraceae bacterium]
MTSDAHRKTVLIVDDDPDIRLFVSGLMKSSGYRPVSAQDRQHGLDKACTEQPDCIILNCTMGGEDGMSLYKSLKTRSDLQHIPVVMVSPVS